MKTIFSIRGDNSFWSFSCSIFKVINRMNLQNDDEIEPLLQTRYNGCLKRNASYFILFFFITILLLTIFANGHAFQNLRKGCQKYVCEFQVNGTICQLGIYEYDEACIENPTWRNCTLITGCHSDDYIHCRNFKTICTFYYPIIQSAHWTYHMCVEIPRKRNSLCFTYVCS